jgi:hypothetical protein
VTALALTAIVSSATLVLHTGAGAASTAAGPSVEQVTLLTPKQGKGIRPVFRWEPVPDAANYLLVVQNKKGRAYWSWQGTETEVPMGGGEKPTKPGSGGPRVADGYRWIVSAFGAGGELLAISKRRPISP